MLAVLSGGGTAGHINPAIALADELVARGHEVRFAGTPNGVEARLITEAGIPFTPFEAAGFNRRHPLSLGQALKLINASRVKAKKWFAQIKPDAVVGFGGYVCIPVCRAAEEMRIPMMLHEQNSVMGVANRELAKGAVKVALTYEAAGNARGVNGYFLWESYIAGLDSDDASSKLLACITMEGADNPVITWSP